MNPFIAILIGKLIGCLVDCVDDVIAEVLEAIPGHENIPGLSEAIDQLRGEPTEENLTKVAKVLDDAGQDGSKVAAALINQAVV